jgi:GxxExxY protein
MNWYLSYAQKQQINKLSRHILDAAMIVHTELGPGMLESAYEICLQIELSQAGFKTERQVTLPIQYREHIIDNGFRADLIVENQIIVELKSVSQIQPVHKAQLLSYMKMSDIRLGLLINFNVTSLKDGIKRIANRF